MAEDSRARTLTIHLAKENRRPHKLIRDTEGLIEKKIPVGGRVTGRLFIRRPEGRPLRISRNVGQKTGLNKVVVGTFEMGTDSSRFRSELKTTSSAS